MADAHSTQTLADRVGQVLRLSPDAPAVEFQGVAFSWRRVSQAARGIDERLQALGIAPQSPIGWVARNGPEAVAAFVALLSAGRPIAPLRPNQAVSGFCDEIRSQRLKAVIGSPADWAMPGVIEAAREAGGAGICVTATGDRYEVSLVPGLETVGSGPHRDDAPGMVVERLSSGTTGPPKRIPVHVDKMLPALQLTEESQSTSAGEPLRLKSSPSIILAPFTHAGGIFALLLAIYQARPVVIFEKFEVGRWVEAVEKYRPKSATLVPAMIRMVLDSDTPKSALSSLKAVRSGTAALDPAAQLAFEERFGVPVLIDYGAAEFIGGVAGWSLAEHRQFAKTKLGSGGKVRSDIETRTLDPDTKAVLPAGEIGQLELYSPRFSPDWIRTNDIARIDSDGFIFIHGRLDDAINRGGFKILPDDISPIIRQFPGVQDATVVGFPDPRLGQVPVAIIEAPDGPLDAEAIKAFLKTRLAPYQVPVDYRFIDAFPRTTTMKIARPELKKMLGLA